MHVYVINVLRDGKQWTPYPLDTPKLYAKKQHAKLDLADVASITGKPVKVSAKLLTEQEANAVKLHGLEALSVYNYSKG